MGWIETPDPMWSAWLGTGSQDMLRRFSIIAAALPTFVALWASGGGVERSA